MAWQPTEQPHSAALCFEARAAPGRHPRRASGLPRPPHQSARPAVPRRLLQAPRRRRRKRVDRQKLIVILVGLPARGKTFLCNKLMCYLNW